VESVTWIFNCINLIWVTDIVEQQYIMTVRRVIKFQIGLKYVKHGVPQGSILGPLLFLLYINNLRKIINKTSAPIIFADDTTILFAHSNPIDFNKNIYIVFITSNKWLTANQQSLNFNKNKLCTLHN